MSRTLAQRLIVLATYLPNRCPGCRGWPTVWIATETDPDPPEQCEICGRRPPYSSLILVGIDPAEI